MSLSFQASANVSDENTVRRLEAQVKKWDGLKTDVYLSSAINFDPDFPCFYSCWESGELVGFLCLFVPSQKEGEITAFVRPDRRRRGIFTSLFSYAVENLREAGVSSLLLYYETGQRAAQAISEKYGAKYHHSEYRMIYEGRTPGVLCDGYTLKKTEPEDIEDLVRLSAELFEETEEQTRAMAERFERSPLMDTYLFYEGNVPVGTLRVNREEGDCVSIWGLGILQSYRRRGLASKMLGETLRRLRETDEREIYLEVDSENPNALGLYRKLGFVPSVQTDYDSLVLDAAL